MTSNEFLSVEKKRGETAGWEEEMGMAVFCVKISPGGAALQL